MPNLYVLSHRMHRWLSLVFDRVSGPSEDKLHERIDALPHLLDESLRKQLHFVVTVRNRLFHGDNAEVRFPERFEQRCEHLRELVQESVWEHHGPYVPWDAIWIASETAPADDVQLVIEGCNTLERLLREYRGAEGRGMVKKLESARTRLSRDEYSEISTAARIRNEVIHGNVALDMFTRERFEEACSWAIDSLEGRPRPLPKVTPPLTYEIPKVNPWEVPADTLAAQGWRLNICLSFVVVLLSVIPSLIAGIWITVRLAPGIAELDDFWLKSVLLAASPNIPFYFAGMLLVVVYLAAFVGVIPITGLMLLSPRWRQFHPEHVLGLASLYLPRLEGMLRGRMRLCRRVITISTHICGVIGALGGLWIASHIYRANPEPINGVLSLLLIGLCYAGGAWFGMGIGLWISAAGAAWTCIEACLPGAVIQNEDIRGEAEAV